MKIIVIEDDEVYKPIESYNFDSIKDNINPSCKNCSNLPKNGGSGICHCILGGQTIWS